MTRADANVNGVAGDRFAAMPSDFVCLNAGYLDAYDGEVFGADDTCPYRPFDPPFTSYEIGGMLYVLAPATAANESLIEGMNLVTSDGPDNCRLDAFSHDGQRYGAAYACQAFAPDEGWDGYIEVVYDAAAMACSPRRLSLSVLRADTYGNDFDNCSIVYRD